MNTTKRKNRLLEQFLNRYRKKDNKESISFAEIPSQYETDLFRIAQDRYNILKEVNELCGPNGDIRFQRANALIGEDATKGGFSIIVNGSAADKRRKQRTGEQVEVSAESERVQKLLDDFLERTQLHILCAEHARALLREGDLFLNVIIDRKRGLVKQIKRAPALTMKRNTDEYGNFTDITKAFSQIDVSQMYQMMGREAPTSSRQDFALYQINHIRWLAEETQPYGTSQYAVARRCYKMLSEMEKALAYRRIYRSVSKRSHRLDTTDVAEIEDYKRANAMVDKEGNPTKNNHMLTDYIGNVEVSALHDEANLDEIKDIEVVENTLWINLLVPKAILTGGQGINRDVLKVQYPHYLQSLEAITDRLEYGDSSAYSGYRAIIDLQLLLQGIPPEHIYYDIAWARKTEETTAERVEGIQNALGKSGGKQLISHEKAIQLIAEDFGIEDPAAMYQRILEEGKSSEIGEEKKEETEEKEEEKEEPEVKKKEGMTDEHEADTGELEELAEAFTKAWETFWEGVWRRASEGELSENSIREAWEKESKGFYIRYLQKAALLGESRGKALVRQARSSLTDGVEIGREQGDYVDIGIERPDIYEDLWEASLSRVKGIEETTLKQAREVLAKGEEAGKSRKELAKELEQVVRHPERAELIALTELSWAYNRSIQRVYRKAGAKEVVWHGSNDVKTCERCRERLGKVYPIETAPENPLHPRCRCTWLPVLSGGGFDNSPNIRYNKKESSINNIEKFKTEAVKQLEILTEQEKQALKKYTGNSAYEINRRLARGEALGQYQEQVEQISAALQKCEIPRDIVVQRKMILEHLNIPNEIIQGIKKGEFHISDIVGLTTTFKAFTSTSLIDFAYPARNTIVKLKVSKGYQGAAYIKNVAYQKYKNQEEVLFDKGLRYKIVSAKIENNNYYLEVEVIP